VTTPLVSVVLPVKNGGPYLAQAVNSILTQSLKDLELLLVDDHSNDAAIEQLDRSDPRLTILSSPSNGVVSAFKHGLSKSNGAFIARMDADDISLPDRLEKQLGYLNQNPSVGIAGACIEIYSQGQLDGGMVHYQHWLNSVRSPDEVFRHLFIESPIPNPTALFRKNVLDTLGSYHETDWPEDYDLFLRAGQAGIAMGKPPEILLKWREHGERLTHKDSRYSRLNFQRAKAHYLAKGRLPDLPLILWGAGPSGRQFFDLLKDEGREVGGFIDVHPRRIGGEKRGKPVWGTEQHKQWGNGFILVAVGSRGAKPEIRAFLNALGRVEGQDYLFVA
jgi:glycosyltransferase involved in cell wall biosynthesis